MSSPRARVAGYLVHLLTAAGAGLGLAALFCAVHGLLSETFAWLGAALVVDAVDGPLARHVDVRETAPRYDGAVLDLVVDFLNYVVVPLVALWRSDLLDARVAAPVCCLLCAASALYFADVRMKTQDLWFRGFPATWNVLVFYLLALRPGQGATLGVVAVAGALMFAPVVFVHPLRVVRLRWLTLTVTAAWGVAAIVAIAEGLVVSAGVKAALIATAFYFLFLPLFRDARAARGGFDG